MSELRYVGILPPLRTQHHPLENRRIELEKGVFREGVVVNKVNDSYNVDIGVENYIEVFGRGPSSGSRVTVKILQKEPLQGVIVKKCNLDYYWGYDVRESSYNLGELAQDSDFNLTIATSRKSKDFKILKNEIRGKWVISQKILTAFGSCQKGIQEIIEIEGKKADECFDYIINTIPNQGTETVRTEEAIHATLALLNMF
jgi:predicted SPOUT superfamily RNA methylase MTH1